MNLKIEILKTMCIVKAVIFQKKIQMQGCRTSCKFGQRHMDHIVSTIGRTESKSESKFEGIVKY